MSQTSPSRVVVLLAAVASAVAAVAATPAGAALWTGTRTIAPAAGPQVSLAMGSDGTAAVAFARNGVRVAVKRPGRSWGEPHRVDAGDVTTTRPTVAVTGRGEVVVAWARTSRHLGSFDRRMAVRVRALSTGGTWGELRQLGTTNIDFEGHVTDAEIRLSANARGETIAVWHGTTQASRIEALQSAFRRPQSAFGAAQTVREPQQPSNSGAVTLDDQGRAHAAWTVFSPAGCCDHPRVRTATRGPGATGSWEIARTIAADPSNGPVITVTPAGTVVMAWRAARADSEGDGIQRGPLDTTARLPDGQFTARQRITASPTHDYGLAVSARGEVALTWIADDVLHAAFRPASGGPFGAAQTIAGVSFGSAAYLGNGTLLYAYGQNHHVRVIHRVPGGTFDTAAPELDRRGDHPLIAAAGARAVTTWNSVSAAAPLTGATRTG